MTTEDGRTENAGEEGNMPIPEDFAKLEFTLSVLKEAIAEVGIKDISEYDGEFPTRRWLIFSQERDRNIVLRMLVNGTLGLINADVTLIQTAVWIVDEVEAILNQPNAPRILDFTEDERDGLLRENARLILMKYVQQIPVVSFQLLSQAVNDAVESHIKTYIEPRLKEHWQSLGLPAKFTISPSKEFSNHLKGIDEQFKSLRKGLLGDRRAWLTDEKRANLDEEHEQLRSDYQVAKDYYSQYRKAFLAGKRNRTDDEWTEEWAAQSSRMFPNLHYRCLSEINDYQPFELAYRHLGDAYDYSPDYIRKLVTQASKLKSSKP